MNKLRHNFVFDYEKISAKYRLGQSPSDRICLYRGNSRLHFEQEIKSRAYSSGLIAKIEEAKSISERPTVIISNNIPGKGVSFMERKFEWHGMPPNKEQAEIALRELTDAREKIVNEL